MKKNRNRKKCYIYTRVSTAAQTEGFSLEAQQERLYEYAEYRELEIVGDYCDAGRSGKSIKGRPEFQRMIEDAIQDVTAKINAAYGEHLTAQELYKVLENFDDIYFKMSDLEKKEFYQNFIESITIYPDKKTNERIIDEIDFKFPIYYDGQEGRAIRLLNETTVETVCLLSKLNVEHHIEVELNLDEMDLTAVESKATYEEIKAYVKEQTGL